MVPVIIHALGNSMPFYLQPQIFLPDLATPPKQIQKGSLEKVKTHSYIIF